MRPLCASDPLTPRCRYDRKGQDVLLLLLVGLWSFFFSFFSFVFPFLVG